MVLASEHSWMARTAERRKKLGCGDVSVAVGVVLGSFWVYETVFIRKAAEKWVRKPRS